MNIDTSKYDMFEIVEALNVVGARLYELSPQGVLKASSQVKDQLVQLGLNVKEVNSVNASQG